MSSFCYDSKDAYNGCLSLYSISERIQHGDGKVISCPILARHKYRMAKRRRVIQSKLQKHNLPVLPEEKITDLVCNFDGSFIGYESRAGKVIISRDDVVMRIWSRDLSWTGCNDKVSTLLSLNMQYSNYHDSFALNDHIWPSLQCAGSVHVKTDSFSIISALEDDNWSVIENELSAVVYNDEWELVSSTECEESKNSIIDMSFDSNILCKENLSKCTGATNQELASDKHSMKRSYLDALITVKSDALIKTNVTKSMTYSVLLKWKPRYAINDVSRIHSHDCMSVSKLDVDGEDGKKRQLLFKKCLILFIVIEEEFCSIEDLQISHGEAKRNTGIAYHREVEENRIRRERKKMAKSKAVKEAPRKCRARKPIKKPVFWK